MSASQQQRAAAKGPRVIIADQADIQGSIQFGDGCIVHPGAYIAAKGGPIIFGENCIIEEKARIVNKVKGKDAQGKTIPHEMKIGSYNVFEAGSIVTSSRIGNLNEFQHKSFVDDNCRIGNACVVGPCAKLTPGTVLADNTFVSDDGRVMVNDESTIPETRKQKVKELCVIQSISIQKYFKVRNV